MHWNLFSTFVALVLGAALTGLAITEIGEWSKRRHEYRMAKLKTSNVVPIRKDAA